MIETFCIAKKCLFHPVPPSYGGRCSGSKDGAGDALSVVALELLLLAVKESFYVERRGKVLKSKVKGGRDIQGARKSE